MVVLMMNLEEVRFSYDFTNPEGQDRIFDMSSTNLEFTLAYLFRIKDSKIEKLKN